MILLESSLLDAKIYTLRSYYKEMDMRLSLGILLTLFLFLSACAGPQPAPSWNLSYTPPAHHAVFRNTISILLIKPVFTGLQQVSDNDNEQPGPADTIAQAYNTDFCLRLQEAIQTDMGKIFKTKGITAIHVADSVEQLTPGDKQKADIVVATNFSFGPQINNSQTTYRYFGGESIVANTGTLQFVGTVTVEFFDPRSNNKVFARTVDAASLSANTTVEYENQSEAEKKFKDQLSRIYPGLMDKIEKSITAEDLQAVLKKIRGRIE